MCLIEPGVRSATAEAVTDVECVATSYDEFIPSLEGGFRKVRTSLRFVRDPSLRCL